MSGVAFGADPSVRSLPGVEYKANPFPIIKHCERPGWSESMRHGILKSGILFGKPDLT